MGRGRRRRGRGGNNKWKRTDLIKRKHCAPSDRLHFVATPHHRVRERYDAVSSGVREQHGATRGTIDAEVQAEAPLIRDDNFEGLLPHPLRIALRHRASA